MKKILFITMLSALVLASLLVACSGNAVEEKAETGTVMVNFKDLYSSSKALSVDTTYPGADSLYWMYTAEKTDGGGAEGQKTSVTSLTDASVPGFGSARAFSVGNWTFTLYGFINDERGSVSNSDVEKKWIYKATTTTDVVFNKDVQTISMNAWATTTDLGFNKGTLQLGTIVTPSTSYTVKYRTSTDGTTYGEWYTSSTVTRITTPEIYVELGMFSGTTELATKVLTVPVYRGLTTTIGGEGGGWDDPTTMISFSVTKPCKVTFVSEYSTGATVVLVEKGKTVTAPATPTTATSIVVGGETYKFVGWYEDEACTTAADFSEAITTDTNFYAKWSPSVITFTIAGQSFTAKADMTWAEFIDNSTYNNGVSSDDVIAAMGVGAGTIVTDMSNYLPYTKLKYEVNGDNVHAAHTTQPGPSTNLHFLVIDGDTSESNAVNTSDSIVSGKAYSLKIISD